MDVNDNRSDNMFNLTEYLEIPIPTCVRNFSLKGFSPPSCKGGASVYLSVLFKTECNASSFLL